MHLKFDLKGSTYKRKVSQCHCPKCVSHKPLSPGLEAREGEEVADIQGSGFLGTPAGGLVAGA